MSKPHVFVIAAITIDGFLSRDSSQPATWSSSEDKRFFRKRTLDSGVMVMGSSTYKTFTSPLPQRKHVVLTTNPDQFDAHQQVEFIEDKPQAVIERLQAAGHDDIAICGGGNVYRQFIDSGLIDTMYITIEPQLFGAGVSFLDSTVDVQFSLDDVEKLNDDSLLITYKRKES